MINHVNIVFVTRAGENVSVQPFHGNFKHLLPIPKNTNYNIKQAIHGIADLIPTVGYMTYAMTYAT